MPREPSKWQVHTRTTSQEWTARSLRGTYPRLNSLSRTIEDEANKRVFFYGSNPISDFYVCHLETMTFKNLMKSLRYWDSTTPFPQAQHEMPHHRLPAIGGPGMAFLRLEDHNLIFIFGGYNGDEDQPSSKLIAIDLDRLIWWVVKVEGKVEGGNITARINPAMTAIGNKIYIFAGITQYAENPEHLRSYNIVEYHPDARTWRWEVCDMPYPDTVPPGQIFGDCIPVHDGKMILLTPGRRTAEDRFRFTENNMFYFHTTHKRFQTAYASGSFPGDVFWYDVRGLDNFERIVTPGSQKQKNSLLSLRASSSHHPYRSSNNSATAFRSANRQFTAPSILICAWVRRLNTEYLVPDLWRFFLSPDEHITCLNIGEKIWDLDLNLRYFTVVGERMILMGEGPDGNSVSGTGDDSINESDDDSNAICDTYVDIPFRQLVLSSSLQRQ